MEDSKKKVTLDDIKARPLVEIAWRGYMDSVLSEWNIHVHRLRMEDSFGIQSNIADIVQDGNDPRDNNDLLDYARWYVEKNVYTDEEWEKYFLPAINEMIAYNDAFVRWMPGYIIRSKKDGSLWVVEYDYAAGFGSSCGRKCRDYTSLCIVRLFDDGHVDWGWAWARYEDYELVDTSRIEEMIARIREYHVTGNHQVPYYLDSNSRCMYYK